MWAKQRNLLPKTAELDVASKKIYYSRECEIEPRRQQDIWKALNYQHLKWGMKVNPDKCKIISPDNNIIGNVDEFTFLGSVVPILFRCKTKNCIWCLWKTKRYYLVPIDHQNSGFTMLLYIVPIATYASETWTLCKENERKLSLGNEVLTLFTAVY